MAASIALRTLLTSLGTFERQERYFEVLLPRMCVNRYYVAAGVANYSRDTWRMVIQDRGRETIVRWLPTLAPFYVLQTKVANSEAREAAAKCIGELAARIDSSAVEPYAVELFRALIPRLGKSDAWEVKDAACTAISEMANAFPERFHLCADFSDLLPSLSATLADVIWSVREGAAIALASLAQASGSAGVLPALCLDGLGSASREVDERAKYGSDNIEALKQQRDNDATLHSNQDTLDCCAVGDLDEDDSEQLVSSGVLALSAIFNHARETRLDLRQDSWERTDGCLYLARELSTRRLWTGAAPGQLPVGQMLDAVARAAMLRHFVKHLALLATLWKVLPPIAEALGNDAFKPHLASFLEALAYTLRSSDAAAAESARGCVEELGRLLGSEAFSACVQGIDASLMDVFSGCLSSR
jgi:hypothetical protein